MLALDARVTGRFAREALASGQGEACALFRRSFYARFPGGRYACVGDESLGRGPLNVLVEGFRHPAMGETIGFALGSAVEWRPQLSGIFASRATQIAGAAAGRAPEEGLGCLVGGSRNALSVHAQPALEALDRWLVGNALAPEAHGLVGLGPGLHPPGDAYLAGVLVALRALERGAQADALWRWLQPRLERTSGPSAAHLEAAAHGEAHESLHAVLAGELALERLDRAGWDGLAGALAVARSGY
jgi:hypothetical protein